MSIAPTYTRLVSASSPTHPSVTDPVPRRRPRYRWRTWIRGRVPWALVDLFPKGWDDCGQHEWYTHDDETDRCYHCEVGVRPYQPKHVPIDDEFRIDFVRAAERGSPSAIMMVKRIHEHDRELGRPRWHPPSSTP